MKIHNFDKIPFYGNTPDNTHCNQAVMKMLLGYYFPNEVYGWKELETITGKKEGLWTWPTQGWVYLKSRGLDVTYYGTFDYDRFVDIGSKYLIEKYGKKVGEEQIIHSDIDYEIEVAKKLLVSFNQTKRIPTLDDVSKFIAQDCLLLCNVNYYPLYGKSGYAGHFVLIYGIDDKYIYIHDPGLPPHPQAEIPIENFIDAWEYSGKENKGLTVVSKSATPAKSWK